MGKYSYSKQNTRCGNLFAASIFLIVIAGCSTTSKGYSTEKSVMAKQVCSTVPIGVPLDAAAAAMYSKYNAILMGGNEGQAFIALKEPEHCACHVGFDKSGLTTTDISVHCLP